jgi:hypothetical protein
VVGVARRLSSVLGAESASSSDLELGRRPVERSRSRYHLSPWFSDRSTRSCACSSTRSPRVGGTRLSSRLRCWCFAGRSRCSSVRSSGSSGPRPIEWCWRRSGRDCHGLPGRLCGFNLRQSSGGTAISCGSAGRLIAIAQAEVDLRSQRNAGSWSSGWRRRTRAGATSGFEASCSSSATRSPLPRFARSYVALIFRLPVEDPS